MMFIERLLAYVKQKRASDQIFLTQGLGQVIDSVPIIPTNQDEAERDLTFLGLAGLRASLA